MAKKVRTIGRKLLDIAEAAWEARDATTGARGSAREQLGELAERRIERLTKQIEALALVAIQGQLGLDSARMTEIVCSPERDEILAEAVVGNWGAVQDLANTIHYNHMQAIIPPVNALADPLTGQTVTLEPREQPGTTSPLHFPCCGGLRPAHRSNCRQS